MSDLMREEFEATYKIEVIRQGKAFDSVVFTRESSGEYIVGLVQSAWWAWQASRERLVIELPKPAGLDRMSSEMSMQEIREDNRFNRALELAKKALTAAGVKYK